MPLYAVLSAGVLIDAVTCDAALGAAQGWTDIDAVSPRPTFGWTLVGTTWTPPAPPPAVPIPAQFVTDAAAINTAGGWDLLTAAQRTSIMLDLLA